MSQKVGGIEVNLLADVTKGGIEVKTLDSQSTKASNSLHTVIAAWLNASQRSQSGVGMNRSAMG